MNNYINRGEAGDVPVAWLEYLAAGIFGGPRPSATAPIRWTGDSHRYGIYRNLSPHGRHSIILLERHGGGMVDYQFDQSYAIETWEALARTLAPEMIWNLCNQIAESYHASRAAERSNMHRAFLEGRMKKRRRNHCLWWMSNRQLMPILARCVMAYRKIDQAMRRGKRSAQEQIKPGVAITSDLVEKAASEAFQHLGQQYLFMTSAMEVMLERNLPFEHSA